MRRPAARTTFKVDIASLPASFTKGGRVYVEADLADSLPGVAPAQSPVWRQFLEVPGWSPPPPVKRLPALLWLYILLPLLALLSALAYWVYREREAGRDPMKRLGALARRHCACCFCCACCGYENGGSADEHVPLAELSEPSSDSLGPAASSGVR